jgi:hypothetical protein
MLRQLEAGCGLKVLHKEGPFPDCFNDLNQGGVNRHTQGGCKLAFSLTAFRGSAVLAPCLLPISAAADWHDKAENIIAASARGGYVKKEINLGTGME